MLLSVFPLWIHLENFLLYEYVCLVLKDIIQEVYYMWGCVSAEVHTSAIKPPLNTCNSVNTDFQGCLFEFEFQYALLYFFAWLYGDHRFLHLLHWVLSSQHRADINQITQMNLPLHYRNASVNSVEQRDRKNVRVDIQQNRLHLLNRVPKKKKT